MYLAIHPTSKEFDSEYSLLLIQFINHCVLMTIFNLNFVEVSVLFGCNYVNKSIQTCTYLNDAIILHQN